VLIVGIGNGTKSLQQFLDGSKEYECTVLFGAATDSYDILGKVTKTAPWEHITKEKVEAALDTLRGPQMQLPPVYSAIRVDGKHLYDYAREGLPLPEIKRRSVIVHELEMLEWLPPDKHEYDLPSQQADAEAKIIAERVSWPKSLMGKRKRDDGAEDEPTNEPAQKIARSSPPPLQEAIEDETKNKIVSDIQASAQDQAPSSLPITENRPPAARLRMKVSSGFYVRSLCHDLGLALNSAGLMAALVRSRQSDFELGKNVIEYEEFDKGSEVWEPQVRKLLEEWQEVHPEGSEKRGASEHQKLRERESGAADRRRQPSKERGSSKERSTGERNYGERKLDLSSRSPEPAIVRRNSSSPD
jgi:tRNA pseudouridine55 synthase